MGTSAALHLPAAGTTVCHGRRKTCQCQAIAKIQQLFGRISGQASQHLNLVDSEPKLTGWLQERGLAMDRQKVVAQQLAGQGRGLVATAAVRQGELLLAVPRQLVIFPQTAAAESALSSLLQEEQLPDWSLLALYLAEQLYYTDTAADGSSKSSNSGSRRAWEPYIDMLPRSPIGTVLDWSPHEVETLLAGSGLRQKAATIISAADLLWQDLQPITTAANQRGLCPPDMFSRADIDWAVGICLSRSVRLDDRKGEVVLVPYADLLNHDTSCEAYLVWDEQQQSVVLRPDRSYKAGEQVFISYGPKSSGELLLLYGYCPPPGSNPHDAAHLTLGIAENEPWKEAKQAALAARGIPASETFAVRVDSLPAGLIPYLAFIEQRPDSEAEVEQLAVMLFDEGRLPSVGTVDCEQVALQALAQQCKAALKGYPQSQDRDRELAATVANGGGFEQREALMAAVRVRERQILSRTDFAVQQRTKQLKKGA